jgi:predicted PhzF superfamily epimerase YddE/YHI9
LKWKSPDKGIEMTAKLKKPEYDFATRFFTPAIGIDEDPVTGSAHCCLGPYWYQKLKKEALIGYQASERVGIVRIRIEGDRVRLGGKEVTIFKGEVTV